MIAPRARTDLTVVELDGEAVVYDERTQTLHHLNATATVVFTLLDGTAHADELAEEIADCTGLQQDEVLHDVKKAIDTFAEAGLLEASDV